MQAKYDLSSKYVDVRAVKQALLESFLQFEGEPGCLPPPVLGRRSRASVEEAAAAARGPGAEVEMKAVFNDAAAAGAAATAAAALEGASVHVKFICMLHIANEQGLELRGNPAMDHVVISRG